MTLAVNSIVWEIRSGGTVTGAGGFLWDFLDDGNGFKWTLSGSGTAEYYVELSAGGDPSLTEANSVFLDGFMNLAVNGTLGSLAASEWDWGDNDSLGFSTVYVRLSDDTDPDTKFLGFVGMGHNGGTDRSQQDAVHATYTDIVIDASDNTKVTSAGIPFAGDDAGNVLHFIDTGDGAGATLDRYSIDTVVGGVATLDKACGSTSETGIDAVLGGAMTFTDANIENTVRPPYMFVQADGTHTLTGAIIITTTTGTNVNPSRMFGYNSTRGDVHDSDGQIVDANRPTIAAGANAFEYNDDDWNFWGINLTTTEASGWNAGSNANGQRKFGCQSTNSSGTASRMAFASSNSVEHYFYGCLGISTNGIAFNGGTEGKYVFCTARDSANGWNGQSKSNAIFCIADTCSIVGFNGSADFTLVNCTAYACGDNFRGNGNPMTLINCISDSATIEGFDFGSTGSVVIYNMNFNNNASDFDPAQASHVQLFGLTFLDPGFTDAAGGDFSTDSGMDIGWPDLMNGFATNLKLGAVQNPAGGGAGAGFVGYIG